jgi:hypothetical protein
MQPCHLGPILETSGVHATLPNNAHFRLIKHMRPCHLGPILGTTGVNATWGLFYYRSTCNPAMHLGPILPQEYMQPCHLGPILLQEYMQHCHLGPILLQEYMQPCHLGPILGTTGVHATLPPEAHLRNYRSTCNPATWGPF